MRRAGRRPLPWLALLTALAALPGCETTIESSDYRPMPPKPVPPPPVPVGAKVNSMAAILLGPRARDTNGNGIADLIAIEVYLFSEPYPTPVFEDGTFVFELYPTGTVGTPGAAPVATWRFSGEAAISARGRSLAGPSSRFVLSLLEGSGREPPLVAGDLVSRFEPADGRTPLHATGVRTVQLTSDLTTVGG